MYIATYEYISVYKYTHTYTSECLTQLGSCFTTAPATR